MLQQLHNTIVLNAPKVLSLPVQLVPFTLQKQILSRLFNSVFAEALADDEFEFLEDKWLQVEVLDLSINWFITCHDNRLVVADKAPKTDVSFKGDVNDLVLITARKEDPDTLFFQRRLKIEGDTELGLEVKNMLDSFELDELPKAVKKLLLLLANFIQRGLDNPVKASAASY